MTNADLKPCPFCGSKPEIETSGQNGRDDYFRVVCEECGAGQCFTDDRKEAVNAWNTRTWEPTPEQMAEMGNLDGPLSRGQIHPVDYIKAVLAVGGEP